MEWSNANKDYFTYIKAGSKGIVKENRVPEQKPSTVRKQTNNFLTLGYVVSGF